MDINYEKFIDTLSDLNRLINATDNGYFWRELCSIEARLRECTNISKVEILNDIEKRLYEKDNLKKMKPKCLCLSCDDMHGTYL